MFQCVRRIPRKSVKKKVFLLFRKNTGVGIFVRDSRNQGNDLEKCVAGQFSLQIPIALSNILFSYVPNLTKRHLYLVGTALNVLTCASSQYNAPSDWKIIGRCSRVMPAGRLTKQRVFNNYCLFSRKLQNPETMSDEERSRSKFYLNLTPELEFQENLQYSVLN